MPVATYSNLFWWVQKTYLVHVSHCEKSKIWKLWWVPHISHFLPFTEMLWPAVTLLLPNVNGT